MGGLIKFGLGFVTGRTNVCNIINNTYKSLIKQFGDIDEKVELTAFIIFDVKYQGTPRENFYAINPEVYDKMNIIYITPEDLENEKLDLVKNKNFTKEEMNMFFGHGHARGRNSVMYYALKNKMDYLLFWDDDEYPVACIKDDKTNEITWKEQDNILMHIKYMDKAEVTIGYHCGYISPIPYIELGEEVDENKFKCFVEALGNDIISWDSIKTKFKENNGITYADKEIAEGKNPHLIKGDGVGKWVAGSTLCLNLNKIDKIPAFYNPKGARGEDTFFSTNLNNTTVIRVPVYHFHDGFLKYTYITKGKYPKTLRRIKTSEDQIQQRFYQASTGWVKYKPLFEYIRDRENYDKKIKKTYNELKVGIPEVNKLFGNNRFNTLLNDLDEYSTNVEKHYKDYLKTNEIWNKLKII